MKLTLIVTADCNTCTRVKLKLNTLLTNRKDITLLVEDYGSAEGNISLIVPALFVENQLYSYGEFNENKLLAYMQNFEVTCDK